MLREAAFTIVDERAIQVSEYGDKKDPSVRVLCVCEPGAAA
jgi:hypothetical protein